MMTFQRVALCLVAALAHGAFHAQTTTLPDFDQGRLWVSPLAVLTTGIHAGYVLTEPSNVVGIQGARLEFNVYDQNSTSTPCGARTVRRRETPRRFLNGARGWPILGISAF